MSSSKIVWQQFTSNILADEHDLYLPACLGLTGMMSGIFNFNRICQMAGISCDEQLPLNVPMQSNALVNLVADLTGCVAGR